MGKGVKVSDKQKNNGKRHRSTQQELCIKYNKERSKLYRDRKKVESDIQSGDLNEKSLSKSIKKLYLLNYKIESYKSKLFKCGKKYAKLKEKKRKLTSRRRYLLKALKTIDVGSKEYGEKSKEVFSITSDLNDLEAIMQMKVIPVGSEIGVVEEPVVDLVQYDTMGFWLVNSLITDYISKLTFTVVYIDDVGFDLPQDGYDLVEYAKGIVKRIEKARAKGGEYMVGVNSNLIKKEVRITTSLEEDEKRK
jgi:hypothetical protein